MRAGSLLTAFALLAARAGADVDVQLKAGKVDVRATAAPLAEVLDRLARATGMKLVQQGTTPAMLLSLHLQDRTPAEAVFGVLEGLGLNYALVLDASGTRIDTLVLAGAAGARTATAGGSAATAPAAGPPPPRYIPQPSAPPPASGPDALDEDLEEAPADEGEEVEEGEAVPPEASPASPIGAPRGSVLQTPSESLFPTSPFAPRAPMFVPQAEPQPAPTPTPPPRPRR